MSGNIIEFDPQNPLKVRRQRTEEEEEEEEEDVRKKRRRGINADEYNEDSSDDDYAKDKQEEEEEEDDMFASDKEEGEEGRADAKPRGIELMDMKEFESVEESNRSDRQGQEEMEDEEDRDYYLDQESTHHLRPKHEPKLDSFNLQREQETGVFDKDGNYYEHAESEDEDWQQIRQTEISKAKRAHDLVLKEQHERDLGKINADFPAEKLLFELIGMLNPVESPLEALQRLAPKKKKKSKNSKYIELTSEEQLKEQERKDQVTKITDHCESLISKGISNVYELEREELMLQYKAHAGVNYVKPKVTPPDNEVDSKWEFRWVNDQQIHGPYTTREVVYWKHHYFDNNAEIRRVGSQDFIHISKAFLSP